MRMLVLGAGLQGSACAYDLLQQPGVERVTIADLEPDRIPAVLRPHAGRRLALLKLDVQDGAALRDAMRGHEAVQNAAPYYFNLAVSRAALDARGHRAGRVRTMEYKTLRYPGHVAIMRPIRELGLLDLTPVRVNGTDVVPRDAFITTVSPKLNKPDGRDLVALRVEVRADNGKRAAWQLLDYYDAAHGISAMMRTTGYSLAITGLMQVDGRIAAPGVRTPDEAVPFAAYVAELAQRGVEIRELA